MKIIPDIEIQKIAPNGHTGQKQSSNANMFKKILDQAVDQPAKNDVESTRISLMNISGLQLNTIPSVNPKVMIERTENLIGKLEAYQKKIGDSAYSLKDINPLVKKIDQDNKELEVLAKNLPDEHELKDIVNQALVTSSMEVIKFNRGDYI